MKFATSSLLILLLAGSVVFAQNDYPTGPIKATKHLYPDHSTSTSVTDPEKRTSEETFRDSAGKLLRRIVYPLNDQNFARGAIHYNNKNVVVYKEIYVFDAGGRIIESKLFDKDNQPLGKRVFVFEGQAKARIEDYDKFGNLISPAASASRRATR